MKNGMTATLVVTAALACALGPDTGKARGSAAAANDPQEAPRATDAVSRSPGRYPGYNGLFHAYLGTDGVQYFTFGSHYSAEDPTHLVIYNDAMRSFFEMTTYDLDESFEFDAGFEIVAVMPKSRDDYYLAGRLEGMDVIEHWKKASATSVAGSSGYVMRRRRLFHGQLGGISSLGVHNRARYLLVLHGTNPVLLSRIALPQGGEPTALFSSADIPQLAAVRYDLFDRRHAQEGIVWTLQDRDSFWDRHYIVFRDLEDDGVIDSWDAYLEPEYASLYRGSPSPWLDNFIGD